MPKFSIVIPTAKPAVPQEYLDLIARYTTDYELLIDNVPGGFAAKLNGLIRRAKGEYIVLMHDDVEVTPGWLDVVPGKNEVGTLKLGEMNNQFDSYGGFVDPPRYCSDATENPDYSFFLVLHRDVVKKMGPLDERFTGPWYQDVDMGLQLKKAGYTITCLPGKIIHRNGHTSGLPDEKLAGYCKRKWRLST